VPSSFGLRTASKTTIASSLATTISSSSHDFSTLSTTATLSHRERRHQRHFTSSLATLFGNTSDVSVSSSEVNKFSQLSPSWWDPTKNPLISMNAIRMEYILYQMSHDVPSTAVGNGIQTSALPLLPLHNRKALDIGCGGGLLSESLARLGATVTAIDPSGPLIRQAQQHALLDPKTMSIHYLGGYTVERLAQEMQHSSQNDDDRNDGLFDIICLLEVVEHATDIPSILKAAQSLLKPLTGRLFVSTLNRTVKSHLMAIIGAEYVLRYLPPGTHRWQQFVSPHELQQLANDCQLQQLDVKGMVVTKFPWKDQWHWKLDPDDTDINWIGTYQAITNATNTAGK
jgi:2-polyprenyl-6-hydroxyphenyl methylase / 3-demethylubiquinone-9 3-methyltransferase